MITSLPTEIIRNIFELTGEYRFRNNQIVCDDPRYEPFQRKNTRYNQPVLFRSFSQYRSNIFIIV